MPTEYIVWIIIAGVVGLLLGFAAAYLMLRRSGSRSVVETMRRTIDQKDAQLEETRQQISVLNRRVEEKDNQLRTARDDIQHLENRLQEKTQREQRAIETLREVARDEAATVERPAVEMETARRQTENRNIAEEEKFGKTRRK